MFPAATKGGGVCFAFPDVLKTPAPPAPPIPIPYPNVGQLAMAAPTTLKLKVMNMPALNKLSKVPLTSGGEMGVGKGLMAPMQLGQVQFMVGSLKVIAEGQPLVALLKTSAHNGLPANAPMGMVSVVAQTKVIVLA